MFPLSKALMLYLNPDGVMASRGIQAATETVSKPSGEATVALVAHGFENP